MQYTKTAAETFDEIASRRADAGWADGEPFGIFTAFVGSIVLTAVGGYYGRKIGKHYGG
ncbi:hypothetical protein [Gemmatimonas sp.]|uniref:hypothetical protein n=1 Tax=Gemmatimonas sp. TaxID=1962908 RepID=UPI003982D82B